MTLEAGERIGRYEIQSLLGTGGMGEVYRAFDTELKRPVALKFLPADIASDPKRMLRFEQEALAASAVNHPNILTVYDIGQTSDGRRFFATELVDGVTLREHLKTRRLKLGEVFDVVIQVASALVEAHAAGVVHRDIKPETIMLRRDGDVKVLDFGVAKVSGRPAGAVDTQADTRALLMTEAGAVMGTVSYMSPEQASGAEVDARTDIWSLGVVLYEMLTGHLPFRGKSASHTIVSILDDDVEDLAELQPPGLQVLAQRHAVHEFGGEEAPPVMGLADVVDRQDVRVVDRRGGERLLLEAPHPLRVGGDVGGQELERHGPLQLRVEGAVHLAHPARPEQCLNLIPADALSGFQSHDGSLSRRAAHRSRLQRSHEAPPEVLTF